MTGPDPGGAEAAGTYPAGPEAVELFRRLRTWNVSSWRSGDRIELTRLAIARLAAIASVQDGYGRPPVPYVGVHALVDQLEVLAADAAYAQVPSEHIDGVLVELADRLGLRRR